MNEKKQNFRLAIGFADLDPLFLHHPCMLLINVTYISSKDYGHCVFPRNIPPFYPMKISLFLIFAATQDDCPGGKSLQEQLEETM